LQAWIDVDDLGRQFLTRVGSGVVLSVTPIGDLGSVRSLSNVLNDDRSALTSAAWHRIAILIDGSAASTSAIRFRASAIIATDDPMYETAMDAIRHEKLCGFTIEWHRHEYMPAELSIDSLDLAVDAHGILVRLEDQRPTARRGAWAH
jgi:hypothetical protein